MCLWIPRFLDWYPAELCQKIQPAYRPSELQVQCFPADPWPERSLQTDGGSEVWGGDRDGQRGKFVVKKINFHGHIFMLYLFSMFCGWLFNLRLSVLVLDFIFFTESLDHLKVSYKKMVISVVLCCLSQHYGSDISDHIHVTWRQFFLL